MSLKFQLPASLLIGAIKTSGYSHTMAEDGMNIALALGGDEDGLLAEDATFAFLADKATQSVTISSTGASTYAKVKIPAMVEQDGLMTINPRSYGLDSVLRSYGGYQVTLSLIEVKSPGGGTEQNLMVYCGDMASEVIFRGIGKPFTPQMRDMGDTEAEFRMTLDEVKAVFEELLPFTAPPSLKAPILKGVNIFQADDYVGFVASDKQRVALNKVIPSYESGKLPPNGVTVYAGVVKAVLDSIKLFSKDDIQGVNVTFTLGSGGRYTICLTLREEVEVCFQYADMTGNFPAAAGYITTSERDASAVKVPSIPLKAFHESLKPLAGLAQAGGIQDVWLEFKQTTVRMAVRSPMGTLIHGVCSCTSMVQQPQYVVLNIAYLMDYLNSSIKSMGAENTTLRAIIGSVGSSKVILFSPPTSESRHLINQMKVDAKVQPSDYFGRQAPLRIKAEKDDKKRVVQLETEPVEEAAPAAAAKPRTVRKKKADAPEAEVAK